MYIKMSDCDVHDDDEVSVQSNPANICGSNFMAETTRLP